MFLNALSTQVRTIKQLYCDSGFQYVDFITDCGIPALAWGFNEAQIGADMVFRDKEIRSAAIELKR